jgi:Arc/MetJ-type ribon-helix-helix transcriptional regulator
MNVILKGKAKLIAQTMVKEGFANSQSEAVRLALFNFGKECLTEDELVAKKMDRIDQEVKSGKRKLLSEKEALGKYADLLK